VTNQDTGDRSAAPNVTAILDAVISSPNYSIDLRRKLCRSSALLIKLDAIGNIKEFTDDRLIAEKLEFPRLKDGPVYSYPGSVNTVSHAEFPVWDMAVEIDCREIKGCLTDRITTSENVFINDISNGVYGDGKAVDSIDGLMFLVSTSPTVGVVGGIDRKSWKFWRNLSMKRSSDVPIQQAMNVMYDRLQTVDEEGNVHGPDLIIADNVEFVEYLYSLNAEDRKQSNSIYTDFGFQSVKFRDADVVLDGGFLAIDNYHIKKAPMWFLTTKYLYLRPHANRNMVRLDPDSPPLSKDALKRYIGWAGNLTMSCAYVQGCLLKA
jgi:hypothetical protein